MPNPLQAGASTVDITPSSPQWLDGYGNRTHPSEGVYQDITAKGLALRAGETQAVLVSAEVLAFDRDRVPALKTRIAARTGVPAEAVVLAATHTHCAPRVCEMVMPGKRDPDYGTWFEEQCVEAAAQAHARLTTARVAMSRAEDHLLGVNRRVPTERGVIMRPNPAGPRDTHLDTLWFEDPRGDQVIASLTVAACHPTCRGFYQVGGDYPGFLWRELERAAGGVGMFVLGCAGDVRPALTDAEGHFRPAELDEVEQAGKSLARAILSARETRVVYHCDRLRLGRRVIQVPLDEEPSRAALLLTAESDPSPLRRQWAQAMLDPAADPPRHVPFEIQAIGFQPGPTVLFWPGEVASEYALWIKNRIETAPGRRILAAAYANGAVGYVPSKAMIPLGGYEAVGSHPYYNLPAPYAPDLEERVREATLDLLNEIT
jgi:hypothetical protein